ncbi:MULTISPECIES: hypothetical protein [unclassified Crossiella]|uniref:hypothetical protein n=1 Tax=unclassified Crossiella TaxID=2620835 RepID=UPI001FFFF155|nr:MULTISPECIES: hypothetical protein [unclassified Crossiella]MCK2242218.1 hypothetical protein [Crossiella sp. S99.2]MCK2254751.1 hypothetical protein [Crossiella sp. S99.1]
MPEDDLIAEVALLLAERAEPGRHHIAAGLKLDGGAVVTALNLASRFGAGSVCAEQLAFGIWARFHREPVRTVVALRATFAAESAYEIVAPCGRCREITLEYAPRAQVLLPDPGAATGIRATPVTALLPDPFVRRITVEPDRN